jgi:hypothetical protein
MANLKDLIVSVAPTIASALGGPFAGAAVGFLSKKLGLSENTAEAVQQAVAGMKPDDLVKMKQLDLDFQKAMAEIGIEIDKAQIAVNVEEAKSTNWFVAGWRPCIGWVCGLALAYVSILEPIIRFFAEVVFSYQGKFPVIDTTITMQVLLGILGLGAMRSTEKIKGKEGNR